MRQIAADGLRVLFSRVPTVIVADRNYNLPTMTWLRGPFAKAFRAFMSEYGTSKWRTTFDCDDFARAYQLLAQMCHTQTGIAEERMQAEGIAIGRVYYMMDSGGGHAINVVVTADNQGINTIKYMEPQTCKALYLSDRELSSRWFVEF